LVLYDHGVAGARCDRHSLTTDRRQRFGYPEKTAAISIIVSHDAGIFVIMTHDTWRGG
jgi:hypothetical protein